MAIDAQDWTRVSAGGLRSLGTVAWNGNGTFTQTVALLPTERTIVMFTQEAVRGTGTANIALTVGVTAGGLQSYNHALVSNGIGYAGRTQGAVPSTAYAPAQISLNWDVSVIVSSNAGGSGLVYLFADTALPERALYNPFSSDYVPVSIGSPLVPPANPDQPGNQLSVRRHGAAPYDFQGASGPAAGAQASVTLTGTAGLRWVLDDLLWTIDNTAAGAARALAQIIDNVTVVWQANLSIPATAGAIDRLHIGPGAGFVGSTGNPVIVRFSAGSGGTISQSVSVGAYQSF